MIIITMIHTVTCHVCHLIVDKARDIGQIQARYTKKWMVDFLSGVDQDNVLLGPAGACKGTRQNFDVR